MSTAGIIAMAIGGIIIIGGIIYLSAKKKKQQKQINIYWNLITKANGSR